MASTNLPSKIGRAIAQYLVTRDPPVVDRLRVYPPFTTRIRDLTNGPIVSIAIWPGEPEPPLTGSDRFKIAISIKGTATADPEDTNAGETQRVAFDAMVGAVRDALMLSEEDENSLMATAKLINEAAYTMSTPVDETAAAIQFAANNADMNDFTLTSWHDLTYGQGKAEDCDWEIVLMFDANACETQLEGYTPE